MTVSTASIPVLHYAEVHIFTHKSWATLVVHHTSVGEMTSKLTAKPLQRISLVRSNREGWIDDDGAGLVGVKTRSTDEATQYEGHRSKPPLPRW